MALSLCPNRERVLLNLKWFVHRVIKSFEMKLTYAVGKTLHKTLHSSRNKVISCHASPVLPSRQPREVNSSNLPLLRQLLENQLNNHNGVSMSSAHKGVGSDDNLKNGHRSPNSIFNQSPLMRVRSLNNSPSFRRLSLPGVNGNHGHQLFAGALLPHDSSISNRSNGSIVSSTGRSSVPSNADSGSPQRLGCIDPAKIRLLHLFDTTNESDRQKAISDFAEQLCVVYEYQLGMLRGLKSVHAAADYVTDLVLKAVRIGAIQTLSRYELTPALLFASEPRPSTATKYIKTCPLNVTGEQLSWRLGEIWTHAGLRHNEVGGENCHNLSIVTHFLSPFTPFGETRRPDIYGYRNLILLPAGNLTESVSLTQNSSSSNDCNSEYKHDVHDEYLNGVLLTNTRHPNRQLLSTEHIENDGIAASYKVRPSHDQTKAAMYFDILPYDAATISRSRIRVGTKDDPLNAVAATAQTTLNPPPKNVGSQTVSPSLVRQNPVARQNNSTNEVLPSQSISTTLNSVVSLRQHLHRAYRPVFFVIFDRPSVLEHLIECDSFAAFCKRQMISPVLFVNQPTHLFDNRTHPSLYHNFDLFRVTVAGYLCQNDAKYGRSPVDTYVTSYLAPSVWRNGASDSNLATDKNAKHRRIAAFDNPGFVC